MESALHVWRISSNEQTKIPAILFRHPNESLAIFKQRERSEPFDPTHVPDIISSDECFLAFGEDNARGTGRRVGGHEVHSFGLRNNVSREQQHFEIVIRYPHPNHDSLVALSVIPEDHDSLFAILHMIPPPLGFPEIGTSAESRLHLDPGSSKQASAASTLSPP